MRIEPDDDVFRIHAVFLGPQGLSLPWAARYTAYGVGFVIFLAILLVEAITPIPVGLPPVWEFCLAVVATYGVMTFVDHDRPLRSVAQAAGAERRAVRLTDQPERVRMTVSHVKIKESA